MLLEVIRDSVTLQVMFYTFVFAGVIKTLIKYLPNITEFIKQFKQ